MLKLIIEFIDNTKEEFFVDDVLEGNELLKYYIRFGADSGIYSIPYSQIKRWKVEK